MRLIFNKNRMGICQIMAYVRKFVVPTGKLQHQMRYAIFWHNFAIALQPYIIEKRNNIMAKNLFNRYVWLVNTIYRAGKITFEEINDRWVNNEMRGGYYYYIENVEDIEHGGLRTWLLNTFSVSNLANESHKLKDRSIGNNSLQFLERLGVNL